MSIKLGIDETLNYQDKDAMNHFRSSRLNEINHFINIARDYGFQLLMSTILLSKDDFWAGPEEEGQARKKEEET